MTANLPSKFHANPFGSFCTKLQTDKQTDNDNYITSLAEVATLLENRSFVCTETVMLHYNILMTEHMDLIS